MKAVDEAHAAGARGPSEAPLRAPGRLESAGHRDSRQRPRGHRRKLPPLSRRLLPREVRPRRHAASHRVPHEGKPLRQGRQQALILSGSGGGRRPRVHENAPLESGGSVFSPPSFLMPVKTRFSVSFSLCGRYLQSSGDKIEGSAAVRAAVRGRLPEPVQIHPHRITTKTDGLPQGTGPDGRRTTK